MSIRTKEKEVFTLAGRIETLAEMQRRDTEGKDSAYILKRLVEISDDFNALPFENEVQ